MQYLQQNLFQRFSYTHREIIKDFRKHTEKKKIVNERFLNSHEKFSRILHDFTCMLLCVTLPDVQSTVQDVEKDVNLYI